MRIKIVQEGVEDATGRTFEHGSLQSRERQIAVLMGGHHDAIIGFASDFQVDEDGWISYDITFRADFLEQFVRTNDKVTDCFDFSGYGINLVWGAPELKTIKKGEIAAIYAIPKPFPATLTKDIPMTKDRDANYENFKQRVLEMRQLGHDVASISGVTEQSESAVLSVLAQHYDGIVDPAEVKAKLGAVTESKDYVKLAREQVAAYINRKAEITDGFKVDISYLYVVWFSKTLKNWKALISTSLPDGMYYEATFDGEKNKLYIDAYKKFDNEAVDL